MRCLVALCLLSSPAFASDLISTPGVVVYVQGQVKIMRDGVEAPAALGAEVHESDTLITEELSQVRVRLFDRSLVRLGPGSRAQMASLRYDNVGEKKEVSMKLFVGKLWASVSKLLTSDSRFEVTANSAVAGVRGTSIGVTAGLNQQTEVTCYDGAVNVFLPGQGDRMVTGGSTLGLTRLGFGPVIRLDTATLMARAADAQGLEQRLDERGASDRAMNRAQARIDAASERAANGERPQARAEDRRERREDRPALGNNLSPAEQRQRAIDTFRDINERAKSTTLRGRIEVRE